MPLTAIYRFGILILTAFDMGVGLSQFLGSQCQMCAPTRLVVVRGPCFRFAFLRFLRRIILQQLLHGLLDLLFTSVEI